MLNLNSLYCEMNKIIKNVDKFKRKNEALSPARKIKTSIKINKIDTNIISIGFLPSLKTNSAKNKGNNLER